MLLPTMLIIAVNLALGFLVAVGRERWLGPRAHVAANEIAQESDEGVPLEEPAQPESPQTAEPATVGLADETAAELSDAAEEAVSEPAEEVAPEILSHAEDDAGEPTPVTAATAEEAATEPETAGSPDVPSETVTALPSEWFDLLGEIENEGYGPCKSFVEAATHVLRLEVGRYRTELVAIDSRLRAIFKKPEPDMLAQTLDDLQRLNADWLVRQTDALNHLIARRGLYGELQAAGDQLEKVLLDQTSQIESTASNIERLNVNATPEAFRDAVQRPLTLEVCRLLDMAHALRDQLHEALLAIAVNDNRLAIIDCRLHDDSLTNFHNRTGLEADLAAWRRDDPHRVRQLSLAMIDIARVGRFNERHGAIAGDRLIASVAQVIDGTLRKKRGCDRVARYSGQRLVVVLGDTGLQNAGLAAERIRQMIAVSSFEIGGSRAEVLITCGVVEVGSSEETLTAFSRILGATNYAKSLGRNVTCCDGGNGPKPLEEVPQYEAKGQIVRLDG